MTKWIASAALALAVLIPTSAFASFVCETTYFPGSNARIRLTLTSSADCAGTSTTYWICEPTNTLTSCAIGIGRYTVPELLQFQSQPVSAADSQQSVSAGTTNCTGGGTGCLYYVSFRP